MSVCEFGNSKSSTRFLSWWRTLSPHGNEVTILPLEHMLLLRRHLIVRYKIPLLSRRICLNSFLIHCFARSSPEAKTYAVLRPTGRNSCHARAPVAAVVVPATASTSAFAVVAAFAVASPAAAIQAIFAFASPLALAFASSYSADSLQRKIRIDTMEAR